MAYALSGTEDPVTGIVEQHDDYANWLVDADFDKDFWEGDWHLLDPFKMVYEMQKHRKGNRAELTSSPGSLMWAESSANRFISEYMDRAFYTAGWDNGVFTDFIKKANAELEKRERSGQGALRQSTRKS